MPIVIKKFGGTSVADIKKIKKIAKRISLEKKSEESIVIVVSAMGNTTDELFNLALQISQKPSQRELDMLVTAGERISMSLLSLALQENGFSAISFTGSQSGIITDIHHGSAKIINVKAFRIFQELEKGKIVIVAGYQGISTLKEVTTLGRGGSDTSAVALACYLNAKSCEIFTDVDGVFTADPRIVPNARIVPEINYPEMLAMAYNGAKVIHSRAVEFAYKYKINVEIKSSFHNKKGTLLVDKIINEEKSVTAVTSQTDLVRFKIETDISDSNPIFEQISKCGLELSNFKFSEKYLEIIIDKISSNNIIKILDSENYSYETENDLNSITFIGVGICKNSLFVVDIINYLNNQTNSKIIDLIAREVSLTFLLKTDNLYGIVKNIHKKIFNTE